MYSKQALGPICIKIDKNNLKWYAKEGYLREENKESNDSLIVSYLSQFFSDYTKVLDQTVCDEIPAFKNVTKHIYIYIYTVFC